MVSRLSAGVLITPIDTHIWRFGVVDQHAVMINRQLRIDSAVRQAANGPGDDQFLAGKKDPPGHLWVRYRPQCQGKKLVGPQGVIGDGLAGRRTGTGVQAIGQVAQLVTEKQVQDGLTHLPGQTLPPLARFRCIHTAQVGQGGLPQGLDLDGVSLARGACRIVGVHPGEM